MRALLLYNPSAGRHRLRRLAQVRAAAQILRERGFAADLMPTLARGSAGEQAAEAIRDGCEAVFACGGDGTVHDVLQGVAGTAAALGVLPFGSANALARELGLSPDPLRAAGSYSPRCTTLVQLRTVRTREGGCRYFLSMAGAAPDGALMYRMLTADRKRWGRWLYYVLALRLFLHEPFSPMEIEISEDGGEWKRETAVALMAVRVRSLGGLFRGLTRGASLHADLMHTVLVRRPASINLPLWFLTSWLQCAPWHPGLISVRSQQISISSAANVHVQADGEWVGTLPAHISLTGDSISLPLPKMESVKRTSIQRDTPSFCIP